MADNRPKILSFVVFIWKAFYDLHQRRRHSMDILPLVSSDIESWLNIHEITGEDRIEMYDLICKMDDAYLEHYLSKQDKPKKKGKK